jgi:hypothetical protein
VSAPLVLARFIGLLLLQVLVLDRLLLHGFVTPYIYVLIVLSLPVTFPTWGAMLMGFAMGVGVDLFLNTGGMHALATVFVAYVRPLVLRVLRPPEGYEPDDRPILGVVQPGWFLTYYLVCILIHHFVYYAVEIFSFSFFLYFLKKWLLTSLATLVLITVAQVFAWKKVKPTRL